MELVAVCISKGQVYIVQGPLLRNGRPSPSKWDGRVSAMIQHPGEVTGNPVLITGPYRGFDDPSQLDLLVPSADGDIFHFARTNYDWRFVGRIGLPQGIPRVPCLSFHSRTDANNQRKLYVLLQLGGRLYRASLLWGDNYPRPIEDRLPLAG
ncbi:hypothetical protein GGR52DRAFT_588058 [Hypoxylon sp. FL1284]|nr:hypothetical protein GGR52DRAFT_588058 [Hypoxylon sp. FL1284]